MILENMVFKYTNEKEECIRIIWINEKNNQLIYVNIYSDVAAPKCDELNKLNEEIENNVLVKVIDPFLKNIDENKVSDVERQKRDRNWALISEVWENRRPELLDKKTRNNVFEDISINSKIPVVTIRRLFSRFWQRGMNKNALISDYKNSGAKGKERNLSEIKVGRPKKTDYYGEAVIGINITGDIKKIFEIAINKYYRTSKKISVTETYNCILRDFFSDKFIDNGEKKFVVWDKSRVPTYEQFYYWFKKFEDPKKDIILREGAKEFELKSREILNNSTIETDGPGTRFQVDATIADIYVVSSLDNNRIIGRPIVYAIIDVFSRLVTGIYVGLEGPSWLGAMMALDNMVTDKVEYCRSYGINITEEQWPAKYVPDIIIADRGEFEGYGVESIINNLNIKIENTSPYRGNLKGIVERNFRTLNTKLKHKAPGAIEKEYRKRGDVDYRLNASITLEEFTRIYINLVLHHNSKIIDKYPMEKEMLVDNIVPCPLQLWKWGIENKKGRLRIVDREIMRLNVLPRGKASVSRAGIRFKGLYYGSQKAIEEQWFIKPKVRSIEIVYDPRNMSNIYIPYEDGKTCETCYLLEPSKQYKDCILEEIIYNFELISELKERQTNSQNQFNVDVDEEIEKIIRQAKKERSKNADNTESNSKRLKGIKTNRAVEKEINRESEAFKINKNTGNEAKVAEVIKLPNINYKTNQEENEGNEGNKRIMEMLRKKRDERREK